MAKGVELCMLHDRPGLLQDTAEFINQEWRRSVTASPTHFSVSSERVQSISESKENLPCSILLVTAEGRVVGHARLLQVAGSRDAALVETVVVLAEMRGRGLGRRIMEACEQHARKLGCRSVHLSTHDQHKFYQRLGYTISTPVNPLRKCTSKLLEKQPMINFFPTQPLTDTAKQQQEKTTDSEESPTIVSSPPPPPSAPPPPPPPAPPALPTVACNEASSSQTIAWYIKTLR